MAEQSNPVEVEPEPKRSESSTGVRMAVRVRTRQDAPTEEIELLAEELVEDALLNVQVRSVPEIPPLPASVLERRFGLSSDPRTPASDGDWSARLESEVERTLRSARERGAYVAELETVLARRSQELLEADEREASLVRRFHLQTLRIGELSRQIREQAELIQELQASLPPRPALTSELLQVRGIGPKYARALSALGVSSLAQLAALSDADVSRIEQQLRIKNGRIQRERWLEQARALEAR
jgi:predicted flap endonuclease-1-like 5' DNA nuclease